MKMEPVWETDDNPDKPPESGTPWVTRLAAAACTVIFLGLQAEGESASVESLEKFGCFPATAIWDGAWWGLISSAFVHFEIWHVAFNVCWLWALGSRLERAIGSFPYLAFIIVAAFVSSSFQLAVSGGMGIGFSGVGYALFGFMWPTRGRYPEFREVLNDRLVQLFLFWLVLCVVTTHLGLWNIGNAAHISGMLFGLAVAGSFALKNRRWLTRSGLAGLATAAVIPLFWCPWSVSWLRHQADEALSNKQYQAALDYYTRIIQREPDNGWAHLQRSDVYNALGEYEKSTADVRKAMEIHSSFEDSE